MPIAISRTAPFRHLQKQIGSATYRLNTILVGLEAIADGASSPSRLPVTWPKPSSPGQARNVADQASIFACTSALVPAADIFDQFLGSLAVEDWLGFSPEARDIATKAITRPKGKGGAYSVAERTTELLKDLKLPISPAVGGLDLLSNWRNVAVHTKKRAISLGKGMAQLLLDEKDHFEKHYSHFDIDLALKNFYGRKNPVPKEATSLIAVVQNTSRALDEAAIKRVAGTPDLIMNVTDKLLREYFTDGERDIPGSTEVAEAWQGSKERRLANFLKILQKVGVTDTSSVVSAVLPQDYITDVIGYTRSEFESRFLKQDDPERLTIV